MIYFYQGLPCDATHDCGDSAVRAGIHYICGTAASKQFSILAYHSDNKPGWVRRHPTQAPWNNWLNCTRDQLMMILAGTKAAGRIDLGRKVFWTHARRGFFCQSIQRDHVGTWKKPWPHKMTGGDPVDEGKWRLFDFADPLWPNHIWAMIKGFEIKWLYWFGIIGIPWFVLSMTFHFISGKEEQNQLIAECYLIGPWAIRLFRFLGKDHWEKKSLEYWDSKGEIEYHLMLRGLICLPT